jgi:hypothetical protein
MSVSADIWRSWRRPQRVMRDLLAQGQREDRALVFLMVACGLIFLAQWPRLARQAQLDAEVPLQAMIGGALLGWFFFAPLIFYALAAVLRLVLVAVRLPVSWYAARLALFWALLAVSPLWLLHGMVAGLAGPGVLTAAVGLVVLGAFFWILGAGLVAAALEARGRRA